MPTMPKIPGYEILQPLGGGLLTKVYTARDCATDKICALKIIRQDWVDQSTAIKLLQREARAGLLVRHPHLVRVIETHVTRPPYFLVMDLVAGESLRQRLHRDYRLDVPTALWVARQTAEALAALHRARFIHGDVKPDNIRLVGDGKAILIDLGFAHRPGENGSFLKKGYVLGTVNYLAPELCAPSPEAGQKSDLFSLGITLFEMLTGKLPYQVGSVKETLERHCSESPRSLRDYEGHFPPALVSLIDQMLSANPAARPRAAAVVAQLIGLEIVTLQRRAA